MTTSETAAASVPPRPLPVATDITRPFWEGTRAHELRVQRCSACGKVQFYPRPFCRHCLSEELEWIACAGTGSIYTFTVNQRAANAHMADKVPYAVAIIMLDEGVKLMGNIVETPLADLKIGDRVAVRWLDVNDEVTLPQFAVEAAR